MSNGVAYLLDANVFSEMMKAAPEPAVANFLDYSLHKDGIGLATITIFEIFNGIGRLPPGRRRDGLSASFEGLLRDYFEDKIFDWTADDARACAAIMEKRQRAGESLDAHLEDAMLAGVALNRKLTVVTRNESEFRNTGVAVVNPWKAKRV